MMDAPWLRECKRLPVGGTGRTRCCGATKAAVLYNKEASWEMYCNRCKQTQRERKQFVQQVQVQPERPVQAAPADAISITDASAEVRSQVYAWLVSKGLMPDMVPSIKWSNSARRMLFPVSSQLSLGRGLSPKQMPKWIQYGGKSSFAYIPPKAPVIAGVVLTEDLLSAYKVAHVSNHYSAGNLVVCALLGTRLDAKLKLLIAQQGWPVLLMLDGDKAGWDGIKRIRREFKAFNNVSVHEFTQAGNDPKDLHVDAILRGINGFTNCFSNDEPESLGPPA